MPKLKLTDIGVLERGKSKHRPRNDKILYGGKYPFIQTSDIKNANHILSTYSQTYNDIGLKQSKLWEKGTICITIAANIADSAILGFDACFPDSVLGLKVNNNKADVEFVEYMLQFYKTMVQNQSNGTSQENINLETFETVYFDIPDLKIQKQIASILSNIDKKIALNNKINEELEEAAKDLYNYWFVQFDFPDGSERPYKSAGGKMVYNPILKREIPEGWECLSLESRLNLDRGNEFGSNVYVENPQDKENYIKFFRVGDMDNSGNTYIPNNSSDIPLLDYKDIAVSFDGSVGRIAYGIAGAYSSGIRKISDKLNILDSSTLFLIFSNQYIQGIIKQYASGSNILHASAAIPHLFIPFDEKQFVKFQQIVKPMYETLVKNKLENQQLTDLRDFLLPMLMNGQVSVS